MLSAQFYRVYFLFILSIVLLSAFMPRANADQAATPAVSAQSPAPSPQWVIAGSPIRDKDTGDMIALECVTPTPTGCDAYQVLAIERARATQTFEVRVLSPRTLDAEGLKRFNTAVRDALLKDSGPSSSWYFDATRVAFVGGLWIAAAGSSAGSTAAGIGLTLLTPVAFVYDLVKDVLVTPFLKLEHFFRAQWFKGRLKKMAKKDNTILISDDDFVRLENAVSEALHAI